jgi:hypothetical protein
MSILNSNRAVTSTLPSSKSASETDLRLKRLYDAIESSIADLGAPALKEHIAGLKALRDQPRVDAERAEALLASAGQKAITTQVVRKFATTARERIRVEVGAIAAITSAHWLSASKWRIPTFGLRD